MNSARMILFTWLVVLNLSCASRPPWPFPSTRPLSPGEQRDVVRARAGAVRTMWALVHVSIDAPELSESFDVVCIFRRPGYLHMSAFKGLILSTQPIFELTLGGDSFRLLLHDREGNIEESMGALGVLPEQQTQIAGLAWLREVMFLPGILQPGESGAEILQKDESLVLEGIAPGGARVRYHLEPDTLGVRSATLFPADGSASFEVLYREYMALDDVFIPGRVEVHRDDGAFTMQAVVGELEVNVDVDEEVFRELEKGGGR